RAVRSSGRGPGVAFLGARGARSGVVLRGSCAPVAGAPVPAAQHAVVRSGRAHASAGYAAAVLADAPRAYWRLGETAGTIALDAAGADPGTYTGGVTLRQPGALPADVDTAAAF